MFGQYQGNFQLHCSPGEKNAKSFRGYFLTHTVDRKFSYGVEHDFDTGVPKRCLDQLSLAPSGVAKSITSFGWVKAGMSPLPCGR